LHNGHLHHIRRTWEEIDPDGVIVVLSSYFTQRGEPALLSKWDRAESAVRAGANLVLELPVFFSSHNAGVFASGAVDVLAATGMVQTISFGMEEPDFDVTPLLDILVHEPITFKDSLKKHLNSGFSYVKARAEALASIKAEYGAFVSSPNNSLALAYMEHIARKGLTIQCKPIQRAGAGYHDTSLKEASSFASASAIRRGLVEGGLEAVTHALPVPSVEIVRRSMEKGYFVLSTDLLWRMVRTVLLRATRNSLQRSSEMTEGMENRLLRYAADCGSWDEFLGKCITHRYPRARIQRQLIHLLLGIGHTENRAFQANGPAYIHPLAADKKGVEMLRVMRRKASLPVRGKLPLHAQGAEGNLASLERVAAEVWESLTPAFIPGTEKKRYLIREQEYAEEGNAL